MLDKLFISTCLLIFIMMNPAHASKKTAALQKNLDQACEEARTIALLPLRSDIYNECVNKFKKDKNTCLKEVNVYNGRRINGAPRFYELPECQKAFNLRDKTNKENSVR